MKNFKKEKYKVIQWATGNQGKFALKMIAERPHLELVGCWVHSEEKVGKEVGDIVGLSPFGVKATNNVEEILALEADCVYFAQFHPDLGLMCRILESGKNVFTAIRYVYLKPGEIRDRIEAACKKGKSSFHSGGMNPGFMVDRLGATITTLCTNFKKFTVLEYSNGHMDGLSEQMIFDAMGFGWTQEQLDAGLPPLYQGMTDDALLEGGDYFAAALGFEVDRWEKSHDFVMANESFDVYGRTIEKGQVAAVRNTYRLYHNEVERINIIQVWIIDARVDTGWGYGEEFYQLYIEGEPSFKVTWDPEGDPMRDALQAGCAGIVNAIPMVCDAEPGIHTTIELPLVTFTGEL